ncbi:hypothetical protein G6F57_006658 [Rhizopus arrhizus]|uniref:Uncharacterized protein n=1 Tax=Rhizopus oryzae TaxID=64495 RepID=A0A9P7BSI2_RHIOR|nr:hypothetical protein G6F23_008194 [Rhizopus arrhizus]KAG1402646.1 hypothetical protein G6F58_010523 [Rhizopus delemar]KAG0762995.1 hypothetical protein G6F24_006362 [Rhizopus arrhizus]KAG0790894.1 hypothetical protein G6F21_005476 [Rhizopus arrhizus]KAG0811297.1 hypothetical protein G6F20_007266 [Rhizopus arrhizus]
MKYNNSKSFHSPRGSFASSSTFAPSEMMTASSFSSIDHPSSASSAVHFLSDSMIMGETSDIDVVDYDVGDVDETLLDHEYMHRNREMVVNTLIKSETSYSNSLLLVKQSFLDVLKNTKQSTFGFLGMKKTICTEREYRWLFANYEELVEFHQDNLKRLNERMKIWGPSQIISDIFQFLATQKTLTGTNLLSLLQLPTTCVHRYFEIISQLSDLTPHLHPDYSGLLKCKQWIVQFRQSLEERLRDVHNIDKVVKIHQSLVDAPFNVRAERRLVLQGNLSRVTVSSRSLGEERRYILFTDMLVFVKHVEQKDRLIYKGHLTLDRVRVRALSKEEAGGIAHCIELIPSVSGIDNLNTTFVGTTSAIVLYVGSEEERKVWIDGLNFVIGHLDRIAMMKQAQETQKRIQERIPKRNLAIASSQPSSIHESNKSLSSRDSSYTN